MADDDDDAFMMPAFDLDAERDDDDDDDAPCPCSESSRSSQYLYTLSILSIVTSPSASPSLDAATRDAPRTTSSPSPAEKSPTVVDPGAVLPPFHRASTRTSWGSMIPSPSSPVSVEFTPGGRFVGSTP